jgi:mono/diheme cytochrome c family protein
VTRTVIIIPLASASVAALVYLFAWRTPLDLKLRHAMAFLLVGVFATASTEYGREMLRKPFVIGRYMYSNGVRVSSVTNYNNEGYLAKSVWTRQLPTNAPERELALAEGEAMFRGQCAACHTREGYRSMKRLIGERNRDAIGSILTMLHEAKDTSPYKKYMPQLVGKPEEIEALADYLDNLAHPPAPKNETLASGK